MKTCVRLGLGLLIAFFATRFNALAQTPTLPDGIISRYTNAELPAWLRFSGEERVRFESLDGVSFKPAGNDYLLQRLRLNLNLTPLPWLRFSFQAQDSRAYFTNVSPAPASQRNPMDLRIGYIQVGNSETGPISMRAGRQSLTLGEGRLVADPNWSNVGRSFDGLRLTFKYRNIHVDAFSGASDKVYLEGFDTPTPAEHFHGLYGSIEKLIPAATIEPYLFWKLEHNVKGEVTKTGSLDEKTAGIRLIGKLPLGFDYGSEVAIQRGWQANEHLASWAMHEVIGHTLADTQHKPRLFAEFNRASGDQNSKDGVHGAFDPLFPSTHDKFGLDDQYTWTNILHARTGFQYKVRANLTVAAAYNSFWLANREDGIYSGGKVTIASNGRQGTHIGQEPDVQAQWTPFRHTLVDLAFGHIFPGEFLQNARPHVSYNSVAFGVTERF